MMQSKIKSVLIFGGAMLATVAGAHHSFTQFDQEHEIVAEVTVVRWEFNNPHSWLRANKVDEDGGETLWSFEGSGPTGLIQRGITGATFRPGDTITILYCPMVDGRPGGALGWARLADGSIINPSDGGCNGDQATIDRWMGWLEKGYTSNKEAMAAEGQ